MKNDDTAPQNQTLPSPPNDAPPRRTRDLPDDITAQSLSTLTAHIDPDHPAARLQTLNKELLALLLAEEEQHRLLRRQTQTMDAMFHALVHHGFADSIPPDATTRADQDAAYQTALNNAPTPNPLMPAFMNKQPRKPEAPKLTRHDRATIALSLQAQRQCSETVRGLGTLSYLDRMMEYVENKPHDAPSSYAGSYADSCATPSSSKLSPNYHLPHHQGGSDEAVERGGLPPSDPNKLLEGEDDIRK